MFVFGLSLFFFWIKTNFDDFCEIFLFIVQTREMVLEKPQNSSVFCTLRTKRERERERREKRRAFIFERFFVKEIFSLARGVCLLFFR